MLFGKDCKMLNIGCHLSISKGFFEAGKEAVSMGANTFQFFTRNPRGGKAKDLDVKDIVAYQQYAAEHGIGQILAHAPYTINACGKDERVQEFARETMADDLRRLEEIPDCKYNFHPGSHVQQGAEDCWRLQRMKWSLFPGFCVIPWSMPRSCLCR